MRLTRRNYSSVIAPIGKDDMDNFILPTCKKNAPNFTMITALVPVVLTILIMKGIAKLKEIDTVLLDIGPPLGLIPIIDHYNLQMYIQFVRTFQARSTLIMAANAPSRPCRN